MKIIKDEYKNRLKQFDELLNFLLIIENNNLYDSKSIKLYSKNNLIINSIKSSLILVIYNIIEFTIINSIKTIEADFKSYDMKNFNNEFQALFYKSFWISLNNLKYESILWIIDADELNLEKIIEYWYFSDSLKLNEKCKIKSRSHEWQEKGIKWNIDYKAIVTISNLFNFKLNKTSHINAWKWDLLSEIRGKRNSISHWHESFNDLWKYINYSLLIKYRNEISKFLDGYIEILDNYINEKPYLKKII